MASRLEFRPGNHTYWLDRTHVPGVTTTIGRAHDKPQLLDWSGRVAAEWCADHLDLLDESDPGPWIETAKAQHRELKESGGNRGTFLHDAARKLVHGDPLIPETDGEPWPADVVGAAHQLARFMDEWDVTPEYVECPVFHDAHIWAGTVDLIATLRDGRRWLLDYKTAKGGVYPKDALQLAAYRHATHIQVTVNGERYDRPMPAVHECACVWIQPDFYELRPVLADWNSYDTFLHMIPVARWTQWKRDETVGPALTIPEAS